MVRSVSRCESKRTKNKKKGRERESSLSWRNIRQVFDCIVFCTPGNSDVPGRPRESAWNIRQRVARLQLHPQSLPRHSSQPWLAKNRINSEGETERETECTRRKGHARRTGRYGGIVRGRSSMRHPSDIPWTKSQTVPSGELFPALRKVGRSVL